MSGWEPQELARIGGADEIGIASLRDDGTARPFVTIWAVTVGDQVYVRSAYGAGNPWFRRALDPRRGRVQVDGVERDVTFDVPGPDVAADITAAYHAKYDHHGDATVGTVVSADAVASTLR